MNDIFGQPIQPTQGALRPRPDPKPDPKPEQCKGEKGTLLRIFIAPGTTISLLGLIEVTSPSGICLLVNIPILSNNYDHKFDLSNILNTLKKSGCKIEFVEQ